MLIVYRKDTGHIVENTGKNDSFPMGVQDVSFVIKHLVSNHGGIEKDYGIFRLHDIEDAELVEKTTTHEYTIQNEKIVFGTEKPIPIPEPQSPTFEEQLAERDKQIIELKKLSSVAIQIAENNSVQLQELLELLVDIGTIN